MRHLIHLFGLWECFDRTFYFYLIAYKLITCCIRFRTESIKITRSRNESSGKTNDNNDIDVNVSSVIQTPKGFRESEGVSWSDRSYSIYTIENRVFVHVPCVITIGRIERNGFERQRDKYKEEREWERPSPATTDLLFLSDFLNCTGHERERRLRDVNEIMASTRVPTM